LDGFLEDPRNVGYHNTDAQHRGGRREEGRLEGARSYSDMGRWFWRKGKVGEKAKTKIAHEDAES
jgi:hypothetical protein